jgi:hypothetical protein
MILVYNHVFIILILRKGIKLASIKPAPSITRIVFTVISYSYLNIYLYLEKPVLKPLTKILKVGV